MLREYVKRKYPQGKSTDAAVRGSMSRSSVEAAVMAVEQRAQVIQFSYNGTTRKEEDFVGKDKAVCDI